MQEIEQLPMPHSSGRLWRIAALITVAIALFLTIRFLSGELFSDAKEVSLVEGIALEQCANKDHDCTTPDSSSWQKGSLNKMNSLYAEGDSVPYRVAFSDLTPGETYLVTIEWDWLKQGKHAIDYLTSYTRTETNAVACNAAFCGSDTAATVAIPSDGTLGSVPQVAGNFSLYGASFTPQGTSITDPSLGNLCTTDPCSTPSNPSGYTEITGSEASQKRITVYFTATNEVVALAWGGHIASQVDWGEGMSASSIEGAPYHMRVVDFRCSDSTNCSSGSMDVSMNVSALSVPSTTTTTVAATTTAVSTTPPPVVTTAPPVVTTAPPVVTTAPPVVTTVPGDLQVITPTPDESPDLQQEFPDELASTGLSANTIRLFSMVTMLFGGLLLINRAFRRLTLDRDEK